jgi:DNA-directed RNA polymerase I subunit RPA1
MGYGDDDDDDGDADDNDDAVNITAIKKSIKESKKGRGSDDDDDEDDDDDASHKMDVETSRTPEKGKRSKANGSASGSSKKKGVSFAPSTNGNGILSAIVNSDKNVKFNQQEGWIETQLSFSSQSRRLLMVQLAERAAELTLVRHTKNIANAYAVQGDGGGDGWVVQTEGVNFEAMYDLSDEDFQFSDLKCNDIWMMLNTYGVEAARLSIVNEVMGVFGSYGINVNPRHLSLIADFMTRTGSYVAMNRLGMNHCPSPFLQMSFETTCTFLVNAAKDGSSDVLESPSARIVTGSVPRVGTGCFDVMIPL